MKDYPIRKINLRGETRYQLDTREIIDGQRYGFRKTYKKKEDAVAARNEYDNDKAKYIKSNSKSKKIKEAMIEFAKSSYFIKVKRKRKSEKSTSETVRDRLNRYNNYLDTFFGDSTLDDITTAKMHDLSNYIQELESIETGDPISQGLMYRLWTDVKAMLHYCGQKGYTQGDVIIKEADEFAKAEYSLPRSWSEEEFDKYLSVIDDATEEKFFRATCACGWRKREGIGLKFKNIDFINSKIRIESQYKGKIKGDTKVKTKKSVRDINTPQIVMNDLRELWEDTLKRGISEKEALNEYCYTNRKGEPLAAETLRRHHHEYCSRAGVRQLRIHDMRHFYATTMLKHGKSIAYIQQQMGHTNDSITIFKHYLAMVSEEKEKENNPFDNMERKE